ncbi:MAG: 6-bladed beta-propeller [Bacteroidales bacterium]|nr:6-bladed beta-propeller [Bacteroidales bacterium]
MKRLLFIFVCLLSITFNACQEATPYSEYVTINEDKVIPFNLEDNITTQPKYSDIYKDVSYILLDNRDEALFSDACSLLFTDQEELIVLDRIGNKILRFDANGLFLNTIGIRGRAENEYLEARNICYDEYNRWVLINDNYKQCILCYTLNGEYVKKIPIGHYINGFCVLDKNYLVCYVDYWHEKNNSARKNNLTVIDHKGNVVNTYFRNKKDFESSDAYVFLSDGQDAFFFPPQSTTLFRLQMDEAIPYCFMQYEPHIDAIHQDSDKISLPLYTVNCRNNYICQIGLNEEILWGSLRKEGRYYDFFVNRKKGQPFLFFQRKDLVNDMLGKVSKQIVCHGYKGSHYNLLYPENFQEVLDTRLLVSTDENKLIERCAKNKNYIIQKCNLK